MIDIPISPNLDCKSFDEYNLLLVKVEGKAGICEEYCFNLRFEPIGESKLDCSELLNTEISFSIRGWDSSTASDDPFYYSGIISNVKKHSPTLEKGLYYSVVVRPVIWRLRRNKRSRVFYDKNVKAIISEVFEDYGFEDYEFKLQDEYPLMEACLQYNETDFDFVSRLIERYGIFYFFEHTEEKTTLVFGDNPASYTKASESLSPFSFYVESTNFNVISGEYFSEQYDIENPSVKKSSLTSSGLNIEKIQSYKEENIDYFENGENDVQAQKISAIDKDISVKKYFIIQAEGFFPVFPGGCVQVGEDGEKENFLVTEVNFQAVTRTDASNPDLYKCDFKCIHADLTYREDKKTQEPNVGLLRGEIIGTEGDTVHTDQYGRYCVKFAFEENSENEKYTCFAVPSHLGVESPLAVGTRVWLRFDSLNKAPYIVGKAYDSEYLPLIEKNKNVTYLATNCPKREDQEKVNSIFFNDTLGEEQKFHIFAHNDMETEVGNNRTTKIKNDDATVLENGNRNVTLQSGDSNIILQKGTYTIEVTEGEVNISSGKNVNIKTEGDVNFDAKNINLKASEKLTVESMEFNISAQTEGTLESKSSLSTKAISTKMESSASCEITSDATVKVKGAVVEVN